MSATPTSTLVSSGSSVGLLDSGDTGVVACPGVMQHQKGTDSSASAPVITTTVASGTAAQLSDLTRDYEVYFTIATGGGTVTIAIGPTNATASTLVNAATGVNGAVIPVPVPAGWWLKITLVTSTIGGQVAIGR